jgi:membrane-bound acyltransferase YfiQ involved in biofilm formation
MGNTSKHLVTDRPFTKKAIEKVFLVLWNIEDYVVLALLLLSGTRRLLISLHGTDLIHYQNILIADFTYTTMTN